jgi:hypothetical protein
MHIYFSKSADGGSTWTTPTQVDTGNKNDSWEPAVDVDQTNGMINVAWYDRRDDSSNKLYRVYYSQSSDGGATFLPQQIAVSTAQSDPTLDCNGTGDYMMIDAIAAAAHPVWSDTRNGINQIFTATIADNQPINTWVNQNPPALPSARIQSGMAYFPGSSSAILFGGAQNAGETIYSADTWSWSGSTWSQLSPSKSPPARFAPTMAYDAAMGDIVLFGGGFFKSGRQAYYGDTWTFNGSTWSQLRPTNSPDPRRDAMMTYDSVRNVLVLFGGYGPTASPCCNFSDTWTFNGTTWTKQSVTPSPSARDTGMMTFDTAHGNSVLFGGRDEFGNYVGDTWLWTGTTWSQQSPASSPSNRDSGAMSYDDYLGAPVLFGGFQCSSCSLGTWYNDTWYWTGSNWSLQSPSASPSVRENAAMAYDAQTRTEVLFGGSTTNGQILGDTWTY